FLGRVTHECGSGNTSSQESIGERTWHLLQRRSSSGYIDWRNTARCVRILPESGHAGLKNLTFILKRAPLEYPSNHFNAFAHYCGRTNFLTLAFANLFHENLRSPQTK